MPRFVFTASCQRVVDRFLREAGQSDQADNLSLALLSSILAEESLGSSCLKIVAEQAGEPAKMFLKEIKGGEKELTAAGSTPLAQAASPLPLDELPWFLTVVERAARIARRSNQNPDITTDQLLLAIAETANPVRTKLQSVGISSERIRDTLDDQSDKKFAPPMKVDFELFAVEPPPQSSPAPPSRLQVSESEIDGSQKPGRGLFALLDANLNRSREGLRVLEDCARFVMHDPPTTALLKNLRHELVAAETCLRREHPALMSSRDVAADVGTELTTSAENIRHSVQDVVIANARRIQEALRSLEEFGKVISPPFAAAVKQIRYRCYSAEQNLLLMSANLNAPVDSGTQPDALRYSRQLRLQRSFVYVLLTESACRLPWKQVATEALQGGADVLQLREKHLSDDALMSRMRWLQDACREAGALFVMNDRTDLAARLGADGVHLGQEDGSLMVARDQLSADQIVGVSTHSLDQLLAACHGKADYLGVGPVFPSTTKTFSQFAGLTYVAQAATHADRPWFAIGGITRTNLPELIQAGGRRVAVSAEVIGSSSPRQITEELRLRLTEAS